MDKTITVRRFDGGLDTLTAPELLPVNKTPDGLNFSITDTGAIQRRDGWVALTATPMRSSPMKALYRYYRETGEKEWLAVCGTALFTSADGVTDTYGVPEAEDIARTTASGALATASWASKGTAWLLTATNQVYSATVPYSTYINARVRGVAGASLRVDGGAWVTTEPSATSKTFSGLTATTHLLEIKPRVPATNSFKLNPQGNGKTTSYTRDTVLSGTQGRTGLYIHFYDDISTAQKPCDRMAGVVGTLGGVFSSIRFGSIGSVSDPDYYYMTIQEGTETLTVKTGIRRATGWWKIDIRRIPDDTGRVQVIIKYATSPSGVRSETDQRKYLFMDSNTIKPYVFAAARSTSTGLLAYFDTIVQNGTLIDSCSTFTGWTRFGGSTSTNHDTISTTVGINSDVNVPTYIDTIQYLAQGGWTRRGAVSASGDTYGFATMNGKAWVGSDYDRVRSWDGATLTATSAYPRAAHLAIKQNRLFAAGRYDDKTLVEYTAVDKPTDWTNGGAIRLTASSGGGAVTGLKSWNDQLLYLGHSTTRALDVRGAEVNWYNREVSEQVGCIAPKTLVVVPNALVFLSADGIMSLGKVAGVLDGDGSVNLHLSEDITPTLKRINAGYETLACAAYYDKRYFISLPLDDATYNSHTLVYRFADNEVPASWTLYDWGVSCFAEGVRGDENALYGGDPTTGNLRRMEYGGTDNGSPIVMSYTIPPINGGTYSTIKHFRRLHLLAKSSDGTQDLAVGFYNDDAPSSTRVVSVTESTGAKPIRIPVNARGRSLGLTLTTSGSEQDIQVSEVTLVHTGDQLR